MMNNTERVCDMVVSNRSSFTGPSIKYVTLFWPIFTPFPLSHFVTHPGTHPRKYVTHLRPPPILEGLVQKTRTKAPLYKFCPEVLSGGLLSGRFCPGWLLSVPVLSEYICY